MGACYSLRLRWATPLEHTTTLEGTEEYAKVVRVIDGDTIEVLTLDCCRRRQHRCRIYGIDTPELHPPHSALNRDNIIASATKARDALARLIDGTIVLLRHENKDKYGRMLARVTTNSGVSVADYMIKHGHAREYFGGKKNTKLIEGALEPLDEVAQATQ